MESQLQLIQVNTADLVNESKEMCSENIVDQFREQLDAIKCLFDDIKSNEPGKSGGRRRPLTGCGNDALIQVNLV